jgi:2-amino-4-hydroxy-6-hydroxymethyldihydropteridine diphosphokinase
MSVAFVAVGSNIKPAENCLAALRQLAGLVRLVGLSTVYLTEPEGRPEQPRYYNCVVVLETDLPPGQLKHEVLRKIEADLGRVRTADRFAARTIDLDLIAYDGVCPETADLTLPDPVILRRPWLAAGLKELTSELRLPVSILGLAPAAAVLPGGQMQPLDDYTQRSKRDLGLGS